MTRYRLTCILSLIALALLISGEVATPARAAAWSTTDLRSGAPLPSGTVSVSHVTVASQVGNYCSDGLQIYGLLCTPTSLPAPYPVAVLNHGLSWVPFNYFGAARVRPAVSLVRETVIFLRSLRCHSSRRRCPD